VLSDQIDNRSSYCRSYSFAFSQKEFLALPHLPPTMHNRSHEAGSLPSVHQFSRPTGSCQKAGHDPSRTNLDYSAEEFWSGPLMLGIRHIADGTVFEAKQPKSGALQPTGGATRPAGARRTTPSSVITLNAGMSSENRKATLSPHIAVCQIIGCGWARLRVRYQQPDKAMQGWLVAVVSFSSYLSVSRRYGESAAI
jgi:hypothetical protein